MQASYQRLDHGFIGLIVSCFNQGLNDGGSSSTGYGERVELLAFQAVCASEAHEAFDASNLDSPTLASLRLAPGALLFNSVAGDESARQAARFTVLDAC